MPSPTAEMEVKRHSTTRLFLVEKVIVPLSALLLEELCKRMRALLEGVSTLCRWITGVFPIIKALAEFCPRCHLVLIGLGELRDTNQDWRVLHTLR